MCSKRVGLIYNVLSSAQGHVQWTCCNVSSNAQGHVQWTCCNVSSNAQGHVQWTCCNVSSSAQGHVQWTCCNVLSSAQGTMDMCLVIKRKVQNGWDANVATWLLQPPHPQGLQLTRPCCASHQHPMTTLLTSCLTLQICMVSCDKREPLNSTGLKLNCVELDWLKLNCLLSWTDLKLNCLLGWTDV